jgi:L-threonylcarbamoyladenylate synthase
MGPERIELAGLRPGDGPALAARLARARLACFPTDTVYGVGGALTAAVAQALVAAKGRAPGKPLQVVLPSLDALARHVELPPRTAAACRALLPGAVTLVVPYPPGWSFPPPARGGDGRPTLGLRVPAWPAPAAVLGTLDLPLVASSANLSGGEPAASADDVDAAVLARCDLLLDAGRVGGTASTVIDLGHYEEQGAWRVLRAGALSEDEAAARLAAAKGAS